MRPRLTKQTAAWAAVLVLLPATLLVPGCTGRGVKPVKHVVLISLDTTRADHMGFLGSTSAKTPNLDALASESIVLTDYMTVVPTTLASHVALFTGKYPHHHGTPRNGFMVNPENTLLAEILKDAGFHTAGFIGSFALDERFDVAQGFDYWNQDFSRLVGEQRADQNQRPAGEVTDAVIGHLDETGVPARLFLFVHYFDPHRPYTPPPPFDTMHDPKGLVDLPSIAEMAENPKHTPKEEAGLYDRHELAYAGEISYMDDEIGRLIDYLAARRILDDALVVITSDHGENFRDHPVAYNHGFSVYQSTMRGVCMFRLPGGRHGGTRLADLVASIDVLPTVLGVLDLDLPEAIDGEAVDLETVAASPRVRYGQATKPRRVEVEGQWANINKARCVRQARYKMIEIPYKRGFGLYDLVEDPGETHNMMDNPSPAVARLAEQLGADLRRWAVSADPLTSEFERKQKEETLERLRSLGYID